MAIPDYQACMLPLLKSLGDGQVRTMRELTDAVAAQFKLTDTERQALLPSGQQTIISNRVAWAKTYLKNAGLLDNPSRGRVWINDQGRSVLAENPREINSQLLERFPSYREFIARSERTVTDEPLDSSASAEPAMGQATPTEMLAASYQKLRQTTEDDLLARLKQSTPAFFERAVVRLLEAMDYGVSGEGQVTGRPGDGGIDGIIREDKLGLDVVCVQAKRWENSVGRPKVQEFVGSMDMVRARKGVIITTSSFTREAEDFVDRIENKKVVLIDGEKLADLMFDHDVGVTTTETYRLKEVSNDFFDEEAE
jgi:restriction system protein